MTAALEILTAADRGALHERTLHVLSTVGVRVDTDEGRRILADAGALVDDATRMVRLPPTLVEQSLALAPKQFSLGGRDPEWSFPLNAGRSTLLNSGGGTMVVDRRTGVPRESTADDWLAGTRLCDAIDEIGVYWATPGGAWNGTQPEFVDYIAALFRTFHKHANDAFSDPSHAPWLLEILDIVCGGKAEVRRRHPYSFLITPVSPLIIEAPGTDSWLALRGWDIPVAVMPMPLMGATAPGSMLGVTLVANCEVIATLCLVQAAAPGTPFIYAPIIAAMDPRSGRYADNAPMMALSCSGTEMARFYGLPVIGQAFCADTWVPDAQSCLEAGYSTLMATLSWPDILVGPGSLAGGMVFSMEQLYIDVEVWRACAKLHDGIAVSDDSWLDDVLARVGPGGSFIGERSTRLNARSGEWYSSRIGRREPSFETWKAGGAPDLVAEARQKVDELLASYRETPFSEDQERALAHLRRRALEQ
jgi:trimethylamine---corrinoid protein Co-methyltransferase